MWGKCNLRDIPCMKEEEKMLGVAIFRYFPFSLTRGYARLLRPTFNSSGGPWPKV